MSQSRLTKGCRFRPGQPLGDMLTANLLGNEFDAEEFDDDWCFPGVMCKAGMQASLMRKDK